MCALISLSVLFPLAGCDGAPSPGGSSSTSGQSPVASREDAGADGTALADGGGIDLEPSVEDGGPPAPAEETLDSDGGISDGGISDAGAATPLDASVPETPDAGTTPPVDAGPLHPPVQEGVWGEVFSGPLDGFTSAATLQGTGDEVLLAIVSTTPYTPVQHVSGLGVLWTRRERQCSSRNTAGIEIWTAQNAAGNGPISVKLNYDTTSAALVISRYRNVRDVSPIGRSVSTNTSGVDGPCTSTNVGLDSASYAVALSSLNPGAAIVVAIATHGVGHEATAPLYELIEAGSGSAVALAVSDVVATGFALSAAGSLTSPADWAAIAVEVKGP